MLEILKTRRWDSPLSQSRDVWQFSPTVVAAFWHGYAFCHILYMAINVTNPTKLLMIESEVVVFCVPCITYVTSQTDSCSWASGSNAGVTATSGVAAANMPPTAAAGVISKIRAGCMYLQYTGSFGKISRQTSGRLIPHNNPDLCKYLLCVELSRHKRSFKMVAVVFGFSLNRPWRKS